MINNGDKVYNVNITTKTIRNLTIVGIVVWLLFTLRNLVFVVLTSVVLASFIRTAAASLKRRLGITRILSIAVMYLLTFLLIASVIYFFLPVLVSEISNLLPLISQYVPGVPTEAFGLTNSEASTGFITQGVQLSGIIDHFSSFLGVVASGFGSTLSALFGSLLNVVLVIVISFYLSVSNDGIESFLRILSPIEREEYVIGLWNRSQAKIARWMQGQLFLGLVIGILTFIGLTLLKVEHALLLAVLAAIFELIPFGIFLAAIPAVSFAFSGGGISLALMVVALYVLIQQLEGYLISPIVMNKMTGISPLVVIISVLIGVQLAGFWGLILAVPVAVTILEYIKDFEKKKIMNS
jgi:predicted PurR-regulated permease PerM